MIGFFLQEVILSSIYIVETVKILHTSLQPRTRTTMKQLILINAVIIGMDLGLLGLECASLYILETLLKGVIYSIKLKLEFAILGKLVNFVGASRPCEDSRKASVGFVTTAENRKSTTKEDRDMDIAEFVDLSRIESDVRHPPVSFASDTGHGRHRSSRASASHGRGFEYDMARFEHIEDISTMTTPRAASMSSELQSPNDGAEA